MSQPLFISCAITGAIHVPSMSPHLPITPEQIATEALAAAQAGACAVHLHARDPLTGQPSMDLDLFHQFCTQISNQSPVVINLTTGGAPTMTPEERMVAIRRFQPELASINMGSINFGLFPMMAKIKDYQWEWEQPYLENSKDLIFKNTFYDQERILGIMADSGTKPEFECYDVAHLYNTAYWADKGLIQPPFWFQLIMGIMGGIQPSVDNLVFMKNTADKLFGQDYVWSVLAAGRHQINLGTVGAVMGGGVRVGLEDSLYLGKGQLAQSNAQQVAKMARILEELSLEPATPEDMRRRLGLKGARQTNFL